MKFYYQNYLGDTGYFVEKEIVKAIYTAWNIEAELFLLLDEKDKNNKIIIFSPNDDNELNSDLLKPFGLYMIDGEQEREIKRIKDNSIVKYDWSEVKKLI